MTPQSLDKAESNLDHVAQACKPAGGVDARELVHQTREPAKGASAGAFGDRPMIFAPAGEWAESLRPTPHFGRTSLE